MVQDVATPHNNILIKELLKNKSVNLNLWYALKGSSKMYQWSKDITNEHKIARVYGTNINLKFIWYCLKKRDEYFVFVGWGNVNTKILHLLFYLMRLKYNHWTDCPQLKTKKRKWLGNKILKHSKNRIFCVGVTAINYFQKLGFNNSDLINLPIFVEVDKTLDLKNKIKDEIRPKYLSPDNSFLISSGSRLVYDKGYDLLLIAISKIERKYKRKMIVVIVGSGNERSKLITQAKKLKIEKNIIFEEWMDIKDFKSLILSSDLFCHPARFDAYGGSTLAMAAGVPVIGSKTAGAALDRIVHKKNGLLYNCDDIKTLSRYITYLFNNPDVTKKMGLEAFKTASSWKPSKGCKIILEDVI